jgi:hypothetical protein
MKRPPSRRFLMDAARPPSVTYDDLPPIPDPVEVEKLTPRQKKMMQQVKGRGKRPVGVFGVA